MSHSEAQQRTALPDKPSVSKYAPIIAVRMMLELKHDMNAGVISESITSLAEVDTEITVEYASDFAYSLLADAVGGADIACEMELDVVEYLGEAQRIVNRALAAVPATTEC